MTTPVRCAIYTRKSSEEGLEQEFNSLQAQREACEAYVRSQRGSGWLTLPTHYDDAGLSGGTLARPALQALLADIDGRKVDLVIVYKVDRLTRSLNDFARIVEVFDAHGVSFVSVTQQFNTSTSMGRLTLNMLLSFAQFEREVTSERIRDKFAASKQKGIWMGGVPPLGYDVVDRKLIINEAEAEQVRRLFRLYLEVGTVRRLRDEATRQGIVTKRRVREGVSSGGMPFFPGHLVQMLQYPLYIGRITHKGKSYPGQHTAIIDQELWDAVQRHLAENAQVRHRARNSKDGALLAGLVFDETGDILSPSHSTKKGRRYRYYISRRIMHGSDPKDNGWRIPGKQLEDAILKSVSAFLRDQTRMVKALPADAPATVIRHLVRGGAEIADELSSGHGGDKRDVLKQLVRRATLGRMVMRLELSGRGLRALALGETTKDSGSDDTPINIDVPIEFRRRGIENKLILRSSEQRPAPNPKLIALIARSHRWMDELVAGKVASVREIARRERLDGSDVSRFLTLAFLAPKAVNEIVSGNHPQHLTAQEIRNLCPCPMTWTIQRKLIEGAVSS